jgi:hypothetical protein
VSGLRVFCSAFADRGVCHDGAKKDFLEDYHTLTAISPITWRRTIRKRCCVEMILSSRAAAFFARNDELNRAVNVNPEKGLCC